MLGELFGSACAFLTILVVVFLSSSLDVLDYNSVGLNYSQIFKSVENATYENGISYIGIGHSFIEYPITVQHVEFSKSRSADIPQINCRTSDGLSLSLEISYQYIIQKDKIYDIYMTYGLNYKTQLLRVSVDSISDTAKEFSALEFFTERTMIAAAMQKALDEAVSKSVHVNIAFFQLRSIDLPDEYENAIQYTEVTKQEIERALAERNTNLVTQLTKVDVARIERQIQINNAQALAEQRKLNAEAQSKTVFIIRNMQSDAYSTLKKETKLDNENLIQYLKTQTIKKYPGGKLVVSIA